MQRSRDRILTTHVGSLPRPPDLLALLEAKEKSEALDQAAFDARLSRAVKEIVAKQVETGIDSVCDGEQSKISYTFYVRHRLAGIGAFTGGRSTSRRRPGRIATSPITRNSRHVCAPTAAAHHGLPAPRCLVAPVRSAIRTGSRWKPISPT
jgi:methionine synthase II (cobalamin-independent)